MHLGVKMMKMTRLNHYIGVHKVDYRNYSAYNTSSESIQWEFCTWRAIQLLSSFAQCLCPVLREFVYNSSCIVFIEEEAKLSRKYCWKLKEGRNTKYKLHKSTRDPERTLHVHVEPTFLQFTVYVTQSIHAVQTSFLLSGKFIKTRRC